MTDLDAQAERQRRRAPEPEPEPEPPITRASLYVPGLGLKALCWIVLFPVAVIAVLVNPWIFWVFVPIFTLVVVFGVFR